MNIKDFLKQTDVQEALQQEDLRSVFDMFRKINGKNSLTLLTEFFYEHNIDPLEYMYTIPNYMFSDLDITSLSIPPTITGIDSFAILRCEELEILRIPSSVVFIGNNAIVGCPKVTIECEADSTIHNWCIMTGRKFKIIE